MDNDQEQMDFEELLSGQLEHPSQSVEGVKKELEIWRSKKLATSRVDGIPFSADQLEKIRWGIEKGVDADIYSFAEIPAVEMEVVRQMLVTLQKDGLDTPKNMNVISRFVCLCVAGKKNISTSIAKELTSGIQKHLAVEKFADPAFSYRQMLQIRQGLEKGIDVSVYSRPDVTEVEMRAIRLDLEKSKIAPNETLPKMTTEQKKATSVQVDPKLVVRETVPAAGIESKIEKPMCSTRTGFDIAQLMQIFLGQRASVTVSKYALLNFSAAQMHEIRLGLEKGIDVSFYSRPNEYAADQMREIRLCMMIGFQPEKGGKDVFAEAKRFQMLDVANKYQYRDSIFRDLLFSREQAEEICRGRKNGLHAELAQYVNPSFSPEQMREIRLGLEKGVDAESYSFADYSPEQMREIRRALEKQSGPRRKLSHTFSRFLNNRKYKEIRKEECNASK